MLSSIRGRVGAWTSASLFVVAAAATLLWYSTASDLLANELDRRVTDQVLTLATLMRYEPEDGGLDLELSDEIMPIYLPGPNASFFQIWRENGSLLERSRSLADKDLASYPTAPHATTPWNLQLPDGRPGRAWTFELQVIEGHPLEKHIESGHPEAAAGLPRVTIMVAVSRLGLEETLASLRLQAFSIGGGLCALTTLIVVLVVRRGLRPLSRLSKEIGDLDPGCLPVALGVRVLPSELAPIRDRLNDLLPRILHAIEREHRVAANMAHELRTPVSELQSLTEVATRWPEDEEFRSRALKTAHAIALRMSTLTEAVLRLTRGSGKDVKIEHRSFDLTDLVYEIWRLKVGADRPDSQLVADQKREIRIVSDRAALLIVISNLVENALDHGGDHPVSASLRVQDAFAHFEVSNSVTEITEDDLTNFTETFWRKDSARATGASTHVGLGLSIASELCNRLGASLTHRLERHPNSGPTSQCLTASIRVRVAADIHSHS